MTQTALSRLLELRRRREEKALEILTLRQGAHRRAREQAEHAAMVVDRHAAASKERERALMASVLGQGISQAALRRLQDNLDVMAMEHSELKERAELARQEMAERAKELQKARQVYHDQHKDAEKLKALRDEESAKSARHRLVIGETIEEDQVGLAAGRSVS